ncbi:MAG: hypothetical protein C0399_11760 [Syntrophus sp. (in: bacteria)]|nr:hypothetical protein [Syntrophus sp. (in: bacteria)]
MTKSEKLLSREFIILGGLFFITSAVMAIFFQLHQYLASLGIDPGWFGFIIGADSLAALFLQPLLSPFLHSGNARKWMLIGLIGMIAALLLYRPAVTIVTLVAVRMLTGAGFICFVSAMTAMIVDYIPAQNSGQAFGYLSLTRLMPYALIPPFVGSLSVISGGFTTMLMYSACFVALSLSMLFLVKSPAVTVDETNTKRQGFTGREVLEDIKDRNVIMLLVVNLLLYSGYTAVFFFLKDYGIKIGIANPGIFFTIATVAMIGIRLLSGTFFDKLNKVSLTVWSLTGLTVCYVALAHTGSRGLFYALALLFGIGWGIVMPLLNALMFDLSQPRFRGLNLNLSLVFMQGSFFIGPFIGGFVMTTSGYRGLFYFCGILSIITAGLTRLISYKITNNTGGNHGS